MNLSRFVLAVTAMILAACATVTPDPPGPNFYVMRHLHTPKGAPDPDLTEEGQSHARLLAGWFGRDELAAIYVSTAKRARQTTAPLAARLGIIPKPYDPADTPGLIAMVTSETGTVLIVGHSNTVPEIVERLGGRRPDPLVHEDFGDIWHVAGPDRVVTRSKLGGK